MTKRELFLALFPNEKATSGNKKYARLTRPQLLKMYIERKGGCIINIVYSPEPFYND